MGGHGVPQSRFSPMTSQFIRVPSVAPLKFNSAGNHAKTITIKENMGINVIYSMFYDKTAIQLETRKKN